MAKDRVENSMSADHLRVVQERRRSNAAGPHGKRSNRNADKRRAIEDQE